MPSKQQHRRGPSSSSFPRPLCLTIRIFPSFSHRSRWGRGLVRKGQGQAPRQDPSSGGRGIAVDRSQRHHRTRRVRQVRGHSRSPVLTRSRARYATRMDADRDLTMRRSLRAGIPGSRTLAPGEQLASLVAACARPARGRSLLTTELSVVTAGGWGRRPRCCRC